jgi:hypothetical protein
MSGKISLPHKCPKCGVVAKTEPELDKVFGYRTQGGGVTIQSLSLNAAYLLPY